MLTLYLALLENPEDEPRFNEFYEKFHKRVYYIAYDHLKNKQSAEDCTQEIFIHLAKNFHNISTDLNDKSVRNFVNIVANNMAVDMYRRTKKHINNVVDTSIDDFPSLSYNDFDIFDEIQLKSAIESLPEQYRHIFYLKYVCNYTGEEIAKMENMSKPLVRKRCMIGMQLVKKYLEDDGEEDDGEGTDE